MGELQRRNADVIALQEVTHELLVALRDAPWIRAAYQISERRVRSYDVVVLSRLPIRRMVEVELPSSMGRRLAVAELACGLAVATVHLESTKTEAGTRARQLEILQPALADRYDDVVLVGDMNFEPGDPLESAVLDPAFVDVWAALRPDDAGYTVDTDINTMRLQVKSTPVRKRIDRVFTRSVDGTFVSDHFGIEVALEAE